MRRFCFGILPLLAAAAVGAEDAADRPVLVLETGGHTAAVVKVLFTPDGGRVVSVSEDHTIRLWDRNTRERLAVYRLPLAGEGQGSPRCAAMSPDGATLAVSGDPYKAGGRSVAAVFLIDLASGTVAGTLPGPADALTALAFSHDGKRLAGGDASGKGAIWDVARRKQTQTLVGHQDVIRDIAFSPDDKAVATASDDKTARVWDPETGKEAGRPMGHPHRVLCLAWRDDGALFTGMAGGPLSVWDRAGRPVRQYDKVRQSAVVLHSLSFLPDKKQLFFTWTGDRSAAGHQSHDSGASLLDLTTETSRDALTWKDHLHEVVGAVAPDGLTAAASGDDDRSIALWAVADAKELGRLAGRGRTLFGVGWSPDGHAVGWTALSPEPEEEPAETGAEPPAKEPPPRAGPKENQPLNSKALQRSFDLARLTFGAKPDKSYPRAAHRLGNLQLKHPDKNRLRVYPVPMQKGDHPTIKLDERANSFTLLGGERVAVGSEGVIQVYDGRTGRQVGKLNGPASMVWEVAPSPDGRYLAAAFGDQVLRIYDPDKEEPLLSLFVAGSDWVAWTKEGYYAASPGGEKLMGWQVNHGLDQFGAFYPAEQFHKAFYRPDVIQRVLAEGSVEKAVAAADKESGATTAALDVSKALPPDVKILSPAEGKQDKAEVEIKAEAVSKDRPVVVIHLLLDGRPFAGAEAQTFPGAKAGDKQEAVWAVKLPEGEHHLAVLAETDAGLGASPEMAVTYQAAATEPLPTLYLLAVGINAYPGSLKLNWAVDDASAVAKAFQVGGAPKPYGKVETNLLTDDKATKEGILAGLDWLKAKMTADDTAVVFYAGHGHRDKKTSQFYMLPSDVDVSDLDKTGVTGTQLKDKLRVVPGRVLVLLDACHSGSIGLSPADPGSLTDDVQRQLAAPDCGVVVMCAAMAQEEAGEAAAVQHGFFTAALLQGLGGKAPASKDGLIHLAALDFYVEEAVAELSKEEQHVVVDRPSTLTSFPLVKPPATADANNRK